jgi:glycosyltransferase involved in cell wall biosynthesis
VSWSTNQRKGTRDIDRLAADHADVDFVLCGRFEGLKLRSNVIHLGHGSRSDVATALRSCDAFLNLSENDPAPNVVIEALASGLPVLYRDSGGVPELVGDCGLPVTIERFREQLDEILARREPLGRAVRFASSDRTSCFRSTSRPWKRRGAARCRRNGPSFGSQHGDFRFWESQAGRVRQTRAHSGGDGRGRPPEARPIASGG